MLVKTGLKNHDAGMEAKFPEEPELLTNTRDGETDSEETVLGMHSSGSGCSTTALSHSHISSHMNE